VVGDEGKFAEVLFDGPDAERVVLWLAERDGKPAGGYRLERGAASPPIVASIRSILDALRVRPALAAGLSSGETPKPPRST
jgi:hypothetical protein